MEKHIAVSVVCNVYNHGEFIRDALEGFVMQKTNFPFEVLVHDDASTDCSADIIREYVQKYPELIKPIYQTENQYSQRISVTRTYQVPRIRGKYVAFCEGDDYWTDPEKLQKQFDFLESHPAYSLCASSTVWLDMRTNKIRSLCKTESDKTVSIEETIREEKGRVFQLATVMVRSEVFISMPDWTRQFGVGDLPLALYAALCGKVYMLHDAMAVYRNHAAGSWTSRIDANVSRKIAAYENLIHGYSCFDAATDSAYNDAVAYRIKRFEYDIARVKRELRTILSKPVREVFCSRRLKSRIADIVYCISPRLFSLLKRVFRP